MRPGLVERPADAQVVAQMGEDAPDEAEPFGRPDLPPQRPRPARSLLRTGSGCPWGAFAGDIMKKAYFANNIKHLLL